MSKRTKRQSKNDAEAQEILTELKIQYRIEKLKGSKKLRPFFAQFEMSSSSSCMEKKIDHKLLHKA